MLQLKDVVKEYSVGEGKVTALKGITVDFRKSEFVAVLGPSGCGKTTLLNIVGGLDSYTSGDLIINGKSTKSYQDADWDTYRNHSVGFVFQSYNLISHQSALSNVEMALKISGVSKTDRRKRAKEALEQVGLADQINKKPNMMSGGQMQRVAIARALVNDPDIILADEPTGSLDSETSLQVMNILEKVAGDRLVIMVTHNPELAEKYATRTILLKDGLVTSDSKPVLAGELDAEEEISTPHRAKLGFKTALGLSFSNLLMKKGRTLLTSFAGAIGIVGIALILALSNGMNNYIADVESDTMGSYPVELQKEAINLESMLSAGSQQGGFALSGLGQTSQSSPGPEEILSKNIVADSVSTSESITTENNLKSFKAYLDTHPSEIAKNTSAVEYGYDVVPQVFRTDTAKGIVQVSPSSLLETEGSGASAMGGNSMSSSTSTAWSVLADNTGLREKQYELKTGTWPTSYNEVALVIDSNNEISDYSLYTLGLMDIEHMEEIVAAVKGATAYEDPKKSFAYSDVIGREFKVFAQSDLYKLDEDGGSAWVDKTEDLDYVASIYESGTSVTITAVLKATEDAEVSSGVVYTRDLTNYLIDKTQQSAIAKQQLADPGVNVLTGLAFEEESTTTQTAQVGFSDTSLYAETTQSAVYKPSNGSYSQQATYSTSTPLLASATSTTLASDAPAADPATTYTVRFLNYENSVLSPVVSTYLEGDSITNIPSENPTRPANVAYNYLFLGWKSSVSNSVYLSNSDLPVVSASVDYIAYYYASPVTAGPETTTPPGGTGGYGAAASGTTMDASSLGSINMSAFSGSSSMGLSQDQISVLLAQMSNDTPSTYEDVLAALGYATTDEPSSIALYPINFEGKKEIEAFIDTYNNQVTNDADKVTYTDLVGTLTSSITSIVNIISYILIAFVAISLVVSSIMIAIITYISVLERTKEIGVLRAIGASKRDISKIFNAETFIEGLGSGVIGILIALLICLPVNAVIFSMFGAENIASLPLEYSLVLIAISVVLTLLAGYIPARIAAKKDPVVALRTE